MNEARQEARSLNLRRIVRRWPAPCGGKNPRRDGLEPKDKLIWEVLFDAAGGIDRGIVIRVAFLVDETSVSKRNVYCALEALVTAGLLDVADRFKGDLTVYLKDPVQAAKARLVSIEDDNPQLFPSAELAVEEPASIPLGDLGDGPADQQGSGPLADGRSVAEKTPLPSLGDRGAAVSTLGARADVDRHPHSAKPGADVTRHPHSTQTDDGASLTESADVDRHPHSRFKGFEGFVASKERELLELNSLKLQSGSADVARSADVKRHPHSPDLARVQRQAEQTRAKDAAAEARLALASPVLSILRALPAPGDQSTKADRIRDYILTQVNGTADEPAPGMVGKGQAAKIAWLIVRGSRFTEASLARILYNLERNQRQGTLKRSRAEYFNGAVSFELRKLQIDPKQ